MSGKIVDITGNRYGRLVVKGYAYSKGKYTFWICRCDCGNGKIIRKDSLTTGNTRSCGCLDTETKKKIFTKHGMYGTSTYNIWAAMLSRCNNPKQLEYHNYGGRGIKVCIEWEDFTNFLNDMGEKPEGMSIDRIDVNKGYSKENCRWATNDTQQNNRRDCLYITYKGRKQTLKQWSRELGINCKTLNYRIYKANWPIEKAFTKRTYRESV